MSDSIPNATMDAMPAELIELFFIYSSNRNFAKTCKRFHQICSQPLTLAKFLLHELNFLPPKLLITNQHDRKKLLGTEEYQGHLVSWHKVFDHKLFNENVGLAIVRMPICDHEYISLFLSWSVSKGLIHIIETLFAEKMLDQGLLNEALVEACANGRREVANLLITFGADVHIEDDAPLCWAAKYGFHGLLTDLIAHGADVNAAQGYPLCFACKHGHFTIVMTLLSHGANVNARNSTPLRWASEFGYKSIVQELLQCAKIEVNAEDSYALRWAATRGHPDIVKMLLDHGANIHAQEGSALKSAIKFGHKEVVELLCSRGATVDDQVMVIDHDCVTNRIQESALDIHEILVQWYQRAAVSRDIVRR